MEFTKVYARTYPFFSLYTLYFMQGESISIYSYTSETNLTVQVFDSINLINWLTNIKKWMCVIK